MNTPSYTWPSTLAFYVIAFALGWLVVLPLWRANDLAHELATPLVAVRMLVPMIALMFGARLRRQSGPPSAKVRSGNAANPYVWMGIALAAGVGVPLVSTFLGAALGWYRLDLIGFSGAMHLPDFVALDLSEGTGLFSRRVPNGYYVYAMFVAVPIIAGIYSLLAAAEETGWRGWLLPALQHKLGIWPALMLTGALWGCWYTPLALLGYRVGVGGWQGVGYTVVACTFLGVFLGWLYVVTGSVRAPALFRGGFDAALLLWPLLVAADQDVADSAIAIFVYGNSLLMVLLTLLLTPEIRAYQRTRTAGTG